jgi:hypothetical protein
MGVDEGRIPTCPPHTRHISTSPQPSASHVDQASITRFISPNRRLAYWVTYNIPGGMTRWRQRVGGRCHLEYGELEGVEDLLPLLLHLLALHPAHNGRNGRNGEPGSNAR